MVDSTSAPMAIINSIGKHTKTEKLTRQPTHRRLFHRYTTDSQVSKNCCNCSIPHRPTTPHHQAELKIVPAYLLPQSTALKQCNTEQWTPHSQQCFQGCARTMTAWGLARSVISSMISKCSWDQGTCGLQCKPAASLVYCKYVQQTKIPLCVTVNTPPDLTPLLGRQIIKQSLTVLEAVGVCLFSSKSFLFSHLNGRRQSGKQPFQ